MGKINSLAFGPFIFNNLLVSYQDLDSDIAKNNQNTRNGIIGNQLLFRFRIIIDYPGEKIWLKPKKKFDKPFKFDRSGMSVFAIGPRLNRFMVKSIIPGSPAEEAGIKSGDILAQNRHLARTDLYPQFNHQQVSKARRKRISFDHDQEWPKI